MACVILYLVGSTSFPLSRFPPQFPTHPLFRGVFDCGLVGGKGWDHRAEEGRKARGRYNTTREAIDIEQSIKIILVLNKLGRRIKNDGNIQKRKRGYVIFELGCLLI